MKILFFSFLPRFVTEYVCLFVCLWPLKQFFSYLLAVTITGDRAANLELCLALVAFISEVLLLVTPTATLDLGLYDLIQRTGPHIPPWDLNLPCTVQCGRCYEIYK
jgi:hypothetical protein